MTFNLNASSAAAEAGSVTRTGQPLSRWRVNLIILSHDGVKPALAVHYDAIHLLVLRLGYERKINADALPGGLG